MARKPFTTRLEAELIRQLKHLHADTDRPLNDLLEEAIRLLLEKHKNKPTQNVNDSH